MLRLHLRKVREKVRGGVANENGLAICIYEPTHLPRANENEKNPLASAIPGWDGENRNRFRVFLPFRFFLP